MVVAAARGLRAALLAVALGALAPLSGAAEVNTASQAELERIKGIGPALSQRLLDERAKAPFSDWADLQKRTGGVKAAAAQRLSAAGLTVNGSAYAGAEAPATPASR
ncbi:ComEA family DNA-binding protein [Rivibacter subsaxonicus]|uniref:Competence protein ComEA n=1 Tax=Rivibacter subsaxonicus TaxID=457575 RepID=A0A4Q7W0L3_9BURK|nr:helix-hairpin-helix domain-containing protein [Rivibacter subsaxonicus]RZU02640.1 competence protein ComEA [Rivibacter subsaxonicus]